MPSSTYPPSGHGASPTGWASWGDPLPIHTAPNGAQGAGRRCHRHHPHPSNELGVFLGAGHPGYAPTHMPPSTCPPRSPPSTQIPSGIRHLRGIPTQMPPSSILLFSPGTGHLLGAGHPGGSPSTQPTFRHEPSQGSLGPPGVGYPGDCSIRSAPSQAAWHCGTWGMAGHCPCTQPPVARGPPADLCPPASPSPGHTDPQPTQHP